VIRWLPSFFSRGSAPYGKISSCHTLELYLRTQEIAHIDVVLLSWPIYPPHIMQRWISSRLQENFGWIYFLYYADLLSLYIKGPIGRSYLLSFPNNHTAHSTPAPPPRQVKNWPLRSNGSMTYLTFSFFVGGLSELLRISISLALNGLMHDNYTLHNSLVGTL
jgi:hypothetical protein